jgi:hypothetical protein
MKRLFAPAQSLALAALLAAAPALQAAIVKGPYLQNAATDSITVCWVGDAEETGAVKYGIGALLDRQVTSDTPSLRHEVRITGLDPDTEYAYQVVSGAAKSELSTFRTAVRAGQPFKFAVIGDTRSGHEQHGKMVQQIVKFGPAFVLNTGDLVGSGSIPQEWDKFFEVTASLIRSVPYYPCLGNHEGNAPAYFDYFALPGTERWYSFDWGNCHFIVLDSNAAYLSSEEQKKWLIDDLRQERQTDFTFVMFHHPLYSGTAGVNRRLGAAETRKYLAPILEEAGVAVVFNGHDHNYQHTFQNGVHYIITGGGGASLYHVKKKWGFSKQAMVHHWLRVFVNGKRLTIIATDINGKVLEKIEIRALE